VAANVLAALDDRSFPRLINARALRKLKELHPLPNQPLGETGLHVVCAIDGERQVAYCTQRHLRALGGDFSQVLARALQHLEQRFDHPPVRKTVLRKEVALIETRDSYDAARLLLVPRQLIPGETLVALVPDRDAQVLSPLPPNGDWRPFERLACALRSDE
jgi:hypothetical protein